MNLLYSTLIKALHQYAKDNQSDTAVLALSGGLDSALLLSIAVRAFGAQNVTALILPEMGTTSNEDIDHAKRLAEFFGVKSHYQPINNFLVDYSFLSWEISDEARANLKARTRSNLLRAYAETKNHLALGSANKSDFLIGYGVTDGEFNADLFPLAELYKTDIIALAKEAGLPDLLIEKVPTRGLKNNVDDEGEFNAPWLKIDDVLRQYIGGTDPETMIEKGMEAYLVHKVVRLVQENENNFGHIPVLHLGDIHADIKAAQAAEASTLS